jgi:hypothetical protein
MSDVASRLQNLTDDSSIAVLGDDGQMWVVEAPGADLAGVPSVQVRFAEDLELVPNVQGNYWITTDEPIAHTFNACRRLPGTMADGTTVVYNGVAQKLRDRLRQHLLRGEASSDGMSGLSVDIMLDPARRPKSHTKAAMCSLGGKRTPFLDGKRVSSMRQLQRHLHMSEDERASLSLRGNGDVFFRNGIHVAETKHAGYVWRVYYATCRNRAVNDHVEKQWRVNHGVPRLCTYSAGR